MQTALNNWITKHRTLVPLILLLGAFCIPIITHADDSYSFTPASPQVWDGTSDVTFNCGATGNYFWIFYHADGTKFATGYAIQSGGLGCDVPFSDGNSYGANFQTFVSGPETVHALYVDLSVSGAYSACALAAGDTYSNCMAHAGWTSAGSVSLDYCLDDGAGSCGSGPPPVPFATTTPTTTPEITGAVTGLAGLGLFSFISGFAVTVWLSKRFLA